jgi:ATP-binding cassette subfamily B protein
MLGQGGVNFSGGQKQRVSITRALVRKPEILILDDSTSAVDVATEARIREGLKEYIKGLTCFVIAHRLSTIRDADTIMVIDGGRIVEKGSHEDLIKIKNGIYHNMYFNQFKNIANNYE